MKRAITSHLPLGDGPPSAATAQKAHSCKIFTPDGKQTTFGAVLAAVSTSKVLVLFIRHFFCGNCQEYIRRIASTLPPSALQSDMQIIVIGCGAPSLIDSYVTLTDCPYPVYAEPKTKLYRLLGMHRTLSLGTRSPNYIQSSLFANAMKSVVQGIKRVGSGDAMQAGNWSVNGGEFLFWRDGPVTSDRASWKVGWCHRMRNSRDHTEVDDLKKHVGLGPRDDGVEEQKSMPVRRATTSKLHRRLNEKSQSLVNSLRRTTSSKIFDQQNSGESKSALNTIDDSKANGVAHKIEVWNDEKE